MVSFSGLEQMLNAYSNNSFSDAKSQKDTAALMDEVNICRVHFMLKRVIFRILVFQPICSVCLFSHYIEQSSQSL
jgi:hypothetical protein